MGPAPRKVHPGLVQKSEGRFSGIVVAYYCDKRDIGSEPSSGESLIRSLTTGVA
jgi:hypothetical protein